MIWYRFPCEISLDEGIETMKFVIYSLIQVPPESQNIIGIANGLLQVKVNLNKNVTKWINNLYTNWITKESTNLSSLDPPLCNGDNILLWGYTDEEFEMENQISEYKNKNDWKEMCTKVLFGDKNIVQPINLLSSHNSSGVCSACATSCWNVNEINPIQVGSTSSCACEKLKSEGGNYCIFSDAIGTMTETEVHVLNRYLYKQSFRLFTNF